MLTSATSSTKPRINEEPNSGLQLFHPISRDNNMPAVRYVLSFIVLFTHIRVLTGIDLPFPPASVAVGGFFSLSGFLLFASFQKRLPHKNYFSRRARRILPPYIFIIILCALSLVGVSSLSWQDYYSDSGFWKYLAANLSYLNFLHPNLPGVFAGPNFATSAVNGALWTMKGEWICFFLIPIVFYIIRKKPQRASLIFCLIIGICIVFKYGLFLLGAETGKGFYTILERQFGVVLTYFFIGALINLLYPLFLRYKWYIFIADILIITFSEYYELLYYILLRPFATGSLIIWFSQIGKWGYFMRKHEDLSYDIYLFHFPIIQLFVYFGIHEKLNPALLILAITVTTVALAYMSWNLVGKRFMPK